MDLICPECKKNKDKSQLFEVFSGSGNSQSSNFVDEVGFAHYHNSCYYLTVFRCTNGHFIKRRRYSLCSNTDCAFNNNKNDSFEVTDEYWEF